MSGGKPLFEIISLEKNSFIEASAGTGKTFTIENLIMRLIREKGEKLEPKNFAIITFTDKATDELTDRIRRLLFKSRNEALEKKSTDFELYDRYYSNFDQFTIRTIHSFCKGILDEYAFENQQSFNQAMITENEVIEELFYEWLDKWDELYCKDLLDFMLAINKSYSDLDGMLAKVKNILGNGLFDYGDVIEPEISESDINEAFQTLEEIANYFEKMTQDFSIDESREEDVEVNKIYQDYNNIYGKKVDNVNLKLAKLKILIKHLTSFNKCEDFYSRCEVLENFFEKDLESSSWNFSKFKKAYINTDFSESILYDIKETLLTLKENYDKINKVKEYLTLEAIKYIREKSSGFKESQGVITFRDMLVKLEKKIQSDDGKLLDIIRKRFKYLIVDEFQDTDRVQYSIFKKIFIDYGKSNKLIVVGDPKQAIYSFRGADVNTYLDAQKDFKSEEMYSLDTNYRSMKELTESVNDFFIKTDWFSLVNSDNTDDNCTINDIKYNAVKHRPESENKSENIDADDSIKSKPFVLADLGKTKSSTARYEFANVIGKEIVRLINQGVSIKLKDDDEKRPVHFGDFAILCRSKKEIRIVEKEFKKKKIPYIINNASGLYEGREALSIYYLLDAVTNENDKDRLKRALMTDFFDIEYTSVLDMQQLNPKSEVGKVFEKWKLMVQNNEISKLLYSFLDDTGLLYRLSMNSEFKKEDSDRILTNYYQIIEHLIEKSSTELTDIYEITKYLRKLIQKMIQMDDEQDDFLKAATEENKVKVLTIHTSKGLEYPIVFVMGGFGESLNTSNRKFYKFYNREKNGYIYDLNKSKSSKSFAMRDAVSDDLRLYYVAITRAIISVYMPLYEKESSKSFITEYLYPGYEKSLKSNDEPSLSNMVISAADIEDQQLKVETSEKEHITNNDENFELFAKKIDHLESRARHLYSFTALSTHSNNYPKVIDEHKENDESNEEISEKIKDDPLPKGAGTGNLLHKIFENIDFDICKGLNNYKGLLYDEKEQGDSRLKALSELIDENIKIYLHRKTKDDKIKKVKDFIYQVIFNTLMTTLTDNKSNKFRLSDLGKNDVLKEVEFVFNEKEETYISGFIDLVFRINDRYYFLDWKSNTLDKYSEKPFEEKVTDEYGLQQEIYLKAINKWLENRLDGYDYQVHFGGVFYMYLRGISSDPENNSGIFYNYPELKSADEKIRSSVNCKLQ